MLKAPFPNSFIDPFPFDNGIMKVGGKDNDLSYWLFFLSCPINKWRSYLLFASVIKGGDCIIVGMEGSGIPFFVGHCFSLKRKNCMLGQDTSIEFSTIFHSTLHNVVLAL